MKILSLTVLILLTTWWPAWSQGPKPRILDELVAYTGPDRQKIILEDFQDLLRPELKGKLAVTTESSSARVIGSMLKYKGDGYMKKLKEQEMRLFKLASLGFLNLLIAGEIAGSPTVFRNQVLS